MMIEPPKCLVLELPSQRADCPIKCLHCIHKSVQSSPYPKLSHDEIIDILKEGRQMGIEYLNIYPHNDEISLEPIYTLPYIKLAYALGYKIKTVSNGANPDGIKQLLPYLYRIALSVDSVKADNYANLRDTNYHHTLLESIHVVKEYKTDNPLLATALIVANKNSMPHINEDIEAIYQLHTFDKIKILEMLPIGSAKALHNQSLDHQSYFVEFAKIKKEYEERLDIGTPLWRIREEGQKGCQLGYKDFIIGPNGQLAGCSLLFYLNNLVGNIREFDSLTKAWNEGFHKFRDKSTYQLDPLCYRCAFYRHDLCWGGCLARAIIFGQQKEIQRSCGITSAEHSEKLYQVYLANKDSGTFLGTLDSLTKEKKL